MFTDSHCHLASKKFLNQELPDIIARAESQGIKRMVTLATCLEDCEENLKITEQYTQVYAAVGIHPCDVHEAPDNAIGHLEIFAKHPRCVAIGETGLDYYHHAPDGWSEDDFKKRQCEFLEQHFELAVQTNKNLVIHTRDKSGANSFYDALFIYKKYADRVRAVFHCFSYSKNEAKQVFDVGGVVSYGGVITYGNSTELLEVVKYTPVGSFMIESDAPYLSPVPQRGKRNEPSFCYYTADRIAGLRKETLEKLSLNTERTVKDFFKLQAH